MTKPLQVTNEVHKSLQNIKKDFRISENKHITYSEIIEIALKKFDIKDLKR